MDRSILHLDMDAFFASVEQRDHPELRGKPIAVGGGIGNVLSKYAEMAREIFALLTHYTDLVEIFLIDEAFMDLTNSKHLFGSPFEIAQIIQQEIYRRFSLTCSIGIGPTKTIAKLASGMNKPNGITPISSEDVPSVLEKLPVEDLCGIGRQITKHLRVMGIRTVGELSRAPREALTLRFGPVLGEGLWRLGQGRDFSPVRPYYVHDSAKSMGHSYTLPKNTEDLEEVKTYLLQLSEQVGVRLRKGGYRGHIVSLAIRYADFSSFSKEKDTHFYTDDGLMIYQYASRMLDEWWQERSQPIRLVGVSLSGLLHQFEQLSLWGPPRVDSLLGAVDRINQRWGRGTLQRARLMHNELAQKTGMIAPEAYGKRG